MKDAKVADEVEGQDNKGAGLIPFGVLCIVLGGAGLGLAIPYLFNQGLADTSELLAAVGSGYAFDFQMPFIIMAGAGIAILGGIIAIVGGALKKRLLGYVAIVIIIAGAGAMIGGAAYLQSVLSTTFVRLQEDPKSTEFNAKELSLIAVTAALFNECCFDVYDPVCGSEYQADGSAACAAPNYDQGTTTLTITGEIRDNELPILPCADSLSCSSSQYPAIISTVESLIPDLTDLLCICYDDQTQYDLALSSVKNLGSCAKLEKIVINDAGSVVIPTTSVTFSQLPAAVGVQSSRSEIKNQDIDKFAVIGKMYPPAGIYGTEQTEIGWSCGLGFAKGLAFALYLGIENAATLPINAAFGIGGALIFFSVLLVIYWAMGGGSEDDDFYGEVDHYQA